MPTPQSNKRKSSGNQNETPQSMKKMKKENITPKKGGSNKPQNSPGQGKLVSPKTPAKTLNNSQSKNSTIKKQQQDSSTKPPKAQKLEMFSGTSKLNLSKNAGDKKAKKQNQGKNEKPETKAQSKDNSEAKLNRHKRRRESLKHKRKDARSKLSELASNVAKGDVEARREVEEKIKQIESLTTKSKNCLKNLRFYKRILHKPSDANEKKESKPQSASALNKGKDKKQQHQVVNRKQQQEKQKQKAPVADDVDDSDEEESDEEQIESKKIKLGNDSDEEDESGDESDDEEEGDDDDEEEDDNEGEEEQGDSSDEEQEDSSDEVQEDSSDEEGEESNEKSSEEETNQQAKKNIAIKNKQKQSQQKAVETNSKTPEIGKSSRYVVFVGNLPYTTSKEELTEHFKKVNDIVDVRVPTDKNTKKPKGFAYVELKNESAYQKALSLHHTFVGGRRINVLYTQGGKKNSENKKSEIKAKNLKLQGMRKQGLLEGSVKADQKRSVRRAKKKQFEKNNGDS